VALSDETRKAIDIEVVDVEDRQVARDIFFAAQVYREASEWSQNLGETSGFAYASALVDQSAAERLSPGATLLIQGQAATTGSVLRVDRTMLENSGRAEALIQISDPERVWRLGDFARISFVEDESRETTVIPWSSVLQTAFGEFVYVLNGGSFLRTAVKTGARQGDYVEVLDGLYSGDQIAARSVETLYLIELRATKGGGHSH